MRVKYQRLYLSETNIKNYVDLLTAIKMPFIVDVSNYTTRITSDNYNIYFLKTEQSNRVFAAGAMLKSELKNKPLPDIDMLDNRYYDTNFNGAGFYADVMYNIDIKGAYASILYNDGLISTKLYRYISSLPKKDRLAAIGMLASKKESFKYDRNGKITSHVTTVNPLSNFFYYCVQRTEHIIATMRNEIMKGSFMFSWVDGAYYNNEHYGRVAQIWLKNAYGLDSVFKKLTDFEVKVKRGFYVISFYDDDERKVFNIPLRETKFRKAVSNYLLTKKYD